MNLTPHQYLSIMDELSLLKIEKERYQRDNQTLTHQIENQRKIIYELKENDRHVLAAYTSGRLFEETTKSFDTKSTGFHTEELQESLGHLQQNFCEFFSTSTAEQMKHMKEEINKIRFELISFQSKRETGEKSKTDSKSSKREEVSEKILKENHRKELQGFFEKAKLVYHLWNPNQKDPGHEELINWMNRLHIKNNKAEPNEEFNPIRAIKEARSEKKQLERNALMEEMKREASLSKKKKMNCEEEENRVIEESLKLLSKNEESKPKAKREKSILNESEISILKPKEKKESKKEIQKERKKESKKEIEKEISKIKKKSITKHKGPFRMIGEQREQKQSKHSREDSNISDLKKNRDSVNKTKNNHITKPINDLKNSELVKSIKEEKKGKKENSEKKTNSSKKNLPKSKSEVNLSKDIDILKSKAKKFEHFTGASEKLMKTSKQMKAQPQVHQENKD